MTWLVCGAFGVACSRGSITHNPPPSTPDPFLAALEALNCSSGQVAKWDGTAWQCAEDNDTDTDTDTLAALTCSADDVAKFNGTAWACAADETSGTAMTGDEIFAAVLDRDGDTAGLNATTLQGLAPAAFAAADHRHFARTINVSAAGTVQQNGAALVAAMAQATALAAADSKWVLVQLDAGEFELPATTPLVVGGRVHLRGAGPAATTIIRRDATRVLVSVPAGASVSISDLALKHNAAGAGEAVALSTADTATVGLDNVLARVYSPDAATSAVECLGGGLTVRASEIIAEAVDSLATGIDVGPGSEICTTQVRDSTITAVAHGMTTPSSVGIAVLNGNVFLTNADVTGGSAALSVDNGGNASLVAVRSGLGATIVGAPTCRASMVGTTFVANGVCAP